MLALTAYVPHHHHQESLNGLLSHHSHPDLLPSLCQLFHRSMPSAKLIAILREPVSRSLSRFMEQYNWPFFDAGFLDKVIALRTSVKRHQGLFGRLCAMLIKLAMQCNMETRSLGYLYTLIATLFLCVTGRTWAN